MKLSIDSTNNLKTLIRLDGRSYIKAYDSPRDQDVLGAIQQACEAENCTIKDITEVFVETGPGSFTGIRVGVSIAQAIAYALNIPLNGHDALDGSEVEYGSQASITYSEKNS